MDIEIINDAIKIGVPVLGTVVGTIIGTLGTYLVTKLQYSRQLSLQFGERYMDSLESVANTFSELVDLAGKHKEEAKVAYYHKYRGEEVPGWVEKNLQVIAQRYHDLLIRITKSDKELNYVRCASQVFK